MDELDAKEQKAIIEGKPTGTFAVMLVFAALFIGVWLLAYFGRYMALGPAS